jgi:hypothetical protein
MQERSDERERAAITKYKRKEIGEGKENDEKRRQLRKKEEKKIKREETQESVI